MRRARVREVGGAKARKKFHRDIEPVSGILSRRGERLLTGLDGKRELDEAKALLWVLKKGERLRGEKTE